jgi:tRNA A-37 threonylcarbamoyl transferase component Bud32/tetratricopeptide (TPR) repeat protein
VRGVSESRISHYRMVSELGRGGMGEVYAAEDEVLRRWVALKSIRADSRLDPELRARFLREARVLSQLDHPNICRIFDYISAPEGDFIVLELIDGHDLTRFIQAGLEPRRALAIASDIASVLAAAHAAGVVHRDVKPANVMISSDGVTKVLDFGLSRFHVEDAGSGAPSPLEHASIGAPQAGSGGTLIWEIEERSDSSPLADAPDGASAHTMRGGVMGTLRYMSPEQARGELVTAASDLYSFGLVLGEMLTGVPPHGPELGAEQVLERARRGISETGPGLDRDLAALIARLKSIDPALRPSAPTVVERLAWIEAQPRRRVRTAAIAVFVLAAIGAATKYTFDLRRERARAQGRTTAALGMMEALFQQQVPVLAEVGRLDAFDAAAEGLRQYFAAVPREELTERELVKLSKLLMLVGDVREGQGRFSEARRSYAEALDIATELEDELPGDSEILLTLGAAHFYEGQLALRHLGDPAAALESFRAYEAAALRNESIDPDPANAAREQIYARNAVVGALLALDRSAQALREQQQIVDFLRQRLVQVPDEPDLRSNLANNLSWLGSALSDAGRTDEALAVYTEELSSRRELLNADPRSATARAGLSFCLGFCAGAQLQLGQVDAAIASAREARDLLRELCEADPGDLTRRRSLVVALEDHAEALHVAKQHAAAYAEYSECLKVGESLVGLDPPGSSLRIAQINAQLEAVDSGLDAAVPLAELEARALDAEQRAMSELQVAPSDRLALRLCVEHVFGRLQHARGDADGARARWEQGLELLAADEAATGEPRLRSLGALLLVRLGRRAEAAERLAPLRAGEPNARRVRDLLEELEPKTDG